MYLNEGNGEACAGQVRAMPKPELNKYDETLDTEENLGAAEPTGSEVERLTS